MLRQTLWRFPTFSQIGDAGGSPRNGGRGWGGGSMALSTKSINSSKLEAKTVFVRQVQYLEEKGEKWRVACVDNRLVYTVFVFHRKPKALSAENLCIGNGCGVLVIACRVARAAGRSTQHNIRHLQDLHGYS